MFEIGEPVPDSTIVHTLDEALAFADKIGFPSSFVLLIHSAELAAVLPIHRKPLRNLYGADCKKSPITQCLIERSIAGFK